MSNHPIPSTTNSAKFCEFFFIDTENFTEHEALLVSLLLRNDRAIQARETQVLQSGRALTITKRVPMRPGAEITTSNGKVHRDFYEYPCTDALSVVLGELSEKTRKQIGVRVMSQYKT